MDRFFKIVCVVLTVILFVSSVMMVFAVSKNENTPKFDLFSCNDIVENIKNMELNMTSIIYIKNSQGNWEEYQRIHGEENRIWVSLDKVPKQLIDAVVAIEDQRYFMHRGVDWKRTGGAFINWLPGIDLYSSEQGGSTITQQLIKNITSDNDKNANRKFREIGRALVMERKLNKNQILEAYLNTISLGNGICGVQVAANYYFNKDVSQLTLTECAAIAGITKNPSAYNPDTKPEGNAERRRTVLDKMLELDMISYEEYSQAYDAELVLDKSQQSNFEIPINTYFVDTLIENIAEDLSEKYQCSLDTAFSMLYNGGYKIYSTIDTNIQSVIDNVYSDINKYFSQKSAKDSSKHVESAITIMDYQGHILGICGGTGEKTVNRGLNRAYNVPQQPGSTMKPIGVYAPAIDRGVITYGSMLQDKPLENYYPDGKKGPKEWYGYYAGNMTLIKAIERSANTIPCHVLKDMGVDASYDFLTQGLEMKHLTEIDKNLSSLALGGCQYGITPTESAAAYAIFGNNGKYYDPVTYYSVERANGEIVLSADTEGKQVIKPAAATIMNRLLQNVVYGSQGTGRGIRSFSKMKAFAKTGTSSEANDLWMVAGSPYYVASVWYGFDKNEAIKDQAAAATVWKTIMTEIHKNLEIKEFEFTTDIVTAKYCKNSGLLAGKRCYSTAEGYFVPGIEAATCSGTHTSTSTQSSSSTPAPTPTPEPEPTPTPEHTPEPTPTPEPEPGEEPDVGGEDVGDVDEPPTDETPDSGEGDENMTPPETEDPVPDS